MQLIQYAVKVLIALWLLRFCYKMVQRMLEQFD
jgi:hypothetical protein